MSLRGSGIWRSWASRDEQSVLGVVLAGYRVSSWRGAGTGYNIEKSSFRFVRTNVFAVVFFISVGMRFVPFGLMAGLFMVALEILTIFISCRFLSWVISSLHGDFHGECSPEKYQSILGWSGALQVPMLIGAILGVWTEPWIAFPLFRIFGVLYGVLVLRQFLAQVMKFPANSLSMVWGGVSAVWILILIGARVMSLSITTPVWVDTLIG